MTDEVKEAIRCVEYDMVHRAGHGADGFVTERKDVARIINAYRNLASPLPQGEVSEERAGAAYDATRSIGQLFWNELPGHEQQRLTAAMLAFAALSQPKPEGDVEAVALLREWVSAREAWFSSDNPFADEAASKRIQAVENATRALLSAMQKGGGE